MAKTKIAEVYSSIRREWGTVKTTTKIHKDKTKYNRKRKHKGRENDFR